MATILHEGAVWMQTWGKLAPPTFQCVRLRSTGIIPSKGSARAAGFDLYAESDGEIAPSSRLTVETGIGVAIPRGWYGRIAPRSGLAHNKGIDVLAGVIDNDYYFEIKVILLNTGTEVFKYSRGDRIAQLVPEFCGEWSIEEVPSLEQNGRGGFGSTGK